MQVNKSSIHGQGVFSLVKIKKNERILEIDDSRVVSEEYPLIPERGEHERHYDYLANGKVVLMQVPERYINHSCDPNVFVKVFEGRRYVYARRNIAKGEEITFDYGGDVVWQCNCGCPRCRKTIHSDFFHLPLALQLEYLPFLSDWFIVKNCERVTELKRHQKRE